MAGAPWSDAVSKTTVGASSLAKAMDQAHCFRSLYGPFREQARSHRECVWQALRRLHAVSPLWEPTCSRRRLIRRAVFGACTGPFASKLAPTGSACGRCSADCMQ
ncbi:hypothetical protein CXB42_15380 [Pseudomonas syringae pv. syringae]|uniref:Uncharacterized protein n=1 Tax=Pseudomonas syringae pv. syringae TaxID=321 RepID=A0AAE5S7F3_PSESY|nr:hypothetical protein CXB42_15380 [Pseudomonas syringae pv. syringae]